jgi:predicted dehydrogenase
MSPVRIGIVGLGIGRVHLQYLSALDDVQLVAVAEPVAELRDWAERHYRVRSYPDLPELLAEEQIDAITIATPPRLHRSQVEQAAARGIHVFLEKPISRTLDDADAIIASSRQAGIVLQLGFKKRFAPAFVWLRDQEAQLGRPRVVTYKFQQVGRIGKDWFWDEADGGGPLVEHACHALDVLAWFLGEPVRVYAETDNVYHPERAPVEEQAAATFRFADGAIATLTVGLTGATAGSYDAGERVSFLCERSVAEVQGWRDTPYLARFQVFGAEEIVERRFEGGHGFPEELAHFVDCVQTGQAPRVGGVDGRRALAMSLALKESGRSHQPVVLVGGNPQ